MLKKLRKLLEGALEVVGFVKNYLNWLLALGFIFVTLNFSFFILETVSFVEFIYYLSLSFIYIVLCLIYRQAKLLNKKLREWLKL